MNKIEKKLGRYFFDGIEIKAGYAFRFKSEFTDACADVIVFPIDGGLGYASMLTIEEPGSCGPLEDLMSKEFDRSCWALCSIFSNIQNLGRNTLTFGETVWPRLKRPDEMNFEELIEFINDYVIDERSFPHSHISPMEDDSAWDELGKHLGSRMLAEVVNNSYGNSFNMLDDYFLYEEDERRIHTFSRKEDIFDICPLERLMEEWEDVKW